MSHPIIVGAGPLGLMAALSLGNHYEKITLIGPDAPKDGRTTAILNEGVDFLNSLGVWEKLNNKTAPLKVMRIVDGTKRLIRAPEARFDSSELNADCFGHNIRNQDLLIALNETIKKHSNIKRIKMPALSVKFDNEEKASITLEDDTVLNTGLLVATDGRNSMVRSAAGIQTTQWSYPQIAMVMDLSHTRDHDFISTEFHTESGPFTLVPLPGKNSSLVWVEKPDEAQKILDLPLVELAQRISEKSHYLLGDVTIKAKPMAYPLSGLTADEFGKGPVVLIGESAHVFPPIGAQGMNLGIRDIKALSDCLTQQSSNHNSAPSSLSDQYSKARKTDVTIRTKAVDTLNRSLLTEILPVHLGRGIGLYAINSLPFLRKFVMKRGLSAE
ncbi:MAG: UbiH/UbiF family hydroxylase [Hyphomicrobiales bacterium]